MHAASDDNSIVLIRTYPDEPATDRALQQAAQAMERYGGEVVAFFHGDGVDHAAGPLVTRWQRLAASGLRLEVCSAAWQRRHEGMPARAFTLSTLVRFWHRLATGYRLYGPEPNDTSPRPFGPWVIRATAAPSEYGSREMLELVLAGASLELPLAVLFCGRGQCHLAGEAVRPWHQLVDFDLAKLYYLADSAFEPEIPAVGVDRAQIDRLCDRSRGVIVL